MGPEALAQVLRPLASMFPAAEFPAVLRGLETPDDAAVWRLDAERAIALTADFFPPVVDDPRDFGAIAAANALSDLYAMGAEPIFGINLVAFPDDLDPAILAEILQGGAEVVRAAGAALLGGHTVTDAEPKYGLAVAGLVHPDRVWAKGGARPGDVLVLSKPLGSGLVTTALKRGRADDSDLAAAVVCMRTLNSTGASALRTAGSAVHAVTDVTGFGLAGHAHEMAEQSGVAIRIRLGDLPVLPGALRYAAADMVPGGAERNAEYYGRSTDLAPGLDPARQALLWDPQTSGGLLAAVHPDAVDALLERFGREGVGATVIGGVFEGRAGAIEVV